MYFRTTHGILVKPDENELWDPNALNAKEPVYPPKRDWDYSRPLQIEDVDVWEVLYEGSGGIGIYASWSPYAEFYLIRPGWDIEKKQGLETYYGAGATEYVVKRAKEIGAHVGVHKVWVDPEDVWKYEPQEPKILIF